VRREELQASRSALEIAACQIRPHLAAVDERQRSEEVAHVGNDLAQEVEAHTLLRVESGSGLIDKDELGIADKGLGDSESLLHAS